MKQNRLRLATTKFGKDCTIIQGMILMGGRTSNLLWECSINWNDGPLYLAEPMHSFGIIHLQFETISMVIIIWWYTCSFKKRTRTTNELYICNILIKNMNNYRLKN